MATKRLWHLGGFPVVDACRVAGASPASGLLQAAVGARLRANRPMTLARRTQGKAQGLADGGRCLDKMFIIFTQDEV
ncbi:MAG: hypothetical protein N838_04380 [Thiohalocapsa sp. PB-PSB1]|jgi:predicted RecB family endonuclease|nr:MAG: hypothetical protein N838_04380 [Thiohalocapsa sp. PB-PSB1]